MAFEATAPDGTSFLMDTSEDQGGESKSVSPMEALLGAIAGCSGMDVISILRKMKQTVTAYHIEVNGERTPEGEYPRPFSKIEVKHFVEGPELDPAAVARAIQLSDEKYCSVMASLRLGPEIVSSWELAARDEVAAH